MQDPIHTLAAFLAESDGLKLWSLIVTIMGDRALAGEEEVAGTDLAAIVERIGLNPQAMRVALHRLKRDGWITSRRDGRISYHALTDKGLNETRAVRDRIYRPLPAPLTKANLNIVQPDAPLPPARLDLVPGVFITVDEARSPDTLTTSITPGDLPRWATALVEKAALVDDMAALADLLSTFDKPAADDSTVFRFLALHAWRRLILRAHPLACRLLPEGNSVERCQAAAAKVLEGG